MTASREDVAVVVLHERNGAYLEECLERLLSDVTQALGCVRARAGKAAPQVLVITDPSRPGAVEEAARAAGRFVGVRIEAVAGPPAERKNAAFRLTTAELVLLVSCMDYVEAGCFEALRSFLESEPRVGAVGALLLAESGWPRKSHLRRPRLRAGLGVWRHVRWMLTPHRYRVAPPHIERAAPQRVSGVPSACALWRRRAWETTEGFASVYGFCLDDLEACVRAARGGWESFLVPTARAYHVAPQLDRPVATEVRLAYEASLWRFLCRNSGAVFRGAFAALRILRSVGGGAWSGPLALVEGRWPERRAPWRLHRAVLRWWVSGRPIVSCSTDAEQTTRWEMAPWCET